MSEFGTIVTVLSQALVALAAIRGVSLWSHKLIGETESRVARALLSSAFQLRDGLAQLRAPMMSGAEMATALVEAGDEIPDDVMALSKKGHRAAQTRRWNRVIEVWNSDAAIRAEAEALWGDTVRPHLTNLELLLREFRSAEQQQALLQDDPHRDHDQFERLSTVNAIITDLGPLTPFTQQIQLRMDEIESLLRPYIRLRKPWMHTWTARIESAVGHMRSSLMQDKQEEQ